MDIDRISGTDAEVISSTIGVLVQPDAYVTVIRRLIRVILDEMGVFVPRTQGIRSSLPVMGKGDRTLGWGQLPNEPGRRMPAQHARCVQLSARRRTDTASGAANPRTRAAAAPIRRFINSSRDSAEVSGDGLRSDPCPEQGCRRIPADSTSQAHPVAQLRRWPVWFFILTSPGISAVRDRLLSYDVIVGQGVAIYSELAEKSRADGTVPRVSAR